MTFGAAILSGGESRRMGKDKSQLTYNGTTFLSRIKKELSCFDELLLSVAQHQQGPHGLRQVCDEFKDCGPMSGLLASLEACRSNALLFVPCDTPLFTGKLGKYLCSLLTDDYDVVIAVSFTCQEHPLCGVYRKSVAPTLRKALEQGENRIFYALDKLRVLRAPISDGGFSDNLLININTPAEYARLCGAAITNIFLVGSTGSGKSGVIALAADLLGLRLGGFVTDFLFNRSGRRDLYMLAPAETMTDMSSHLVAGEGEDAVPNIERFNKLGCAYLSEPADAELIIMDELGSLETEAYDFRRKVMNVLDSPVPVLGALHDVSSGWTAELAERCDVRVITVTPENRDTLPLVISNMIGSMRRVV